MKVRIRRSGGYAGGDQEVAVFDTGALGREGAELERRVAALERSAAAGDEPVGADLVQYEVEIGDGQRRFRVTDEGDPTAPALLALERVLEALPAPSRR